MLSCRSDLKNYALRKLGYPVMTINVAPEQIEDRIDEALQMYWEFHRDGTYRDFLKYQLTQQNLDTKVIQVPDWVYSVIQILPLGSEYDQSNLEFMSFMQSLGTQVIIAGGLSNYVISQSYMSLVRDFFSRERQIEFVQNHNEINIHSTLNGFSVDDYLIFEVYRLCDPMTYRKTWNDLWLKNYTTALIKRQWGQNMIKYDGFQMPSGITLNGRAIYDDALNDIELLKAELFSSEILPPDFFVG